MSRIPFAAALVLAMLFTARSPIFAEESGLFRHFVSFQFKESTSDKQINEVVKGFMALEGQIDTIVALEWGGTENIEPRNDGFTHSFLVSFKNKAGLETYLPHPAHEKFKTLLIPLLEKAYVFDYTAK